MKVLKVEHPWFESLMEAIIIDSKETRKKSKNNNHNKFNKLAYLDQQDGYTIGSRFLVELGRAATEDGTFDRFLINNPALIEFSKNHKFFRSLLTSIGKEMKHRATWRKLLLSILAALMSIFDISTDIYTINYYNSIWEGETARWMLTFVILSLVLQIIVVVAIHHRNKRRLIIELVGTMSFTKPA